MPNLCTELREAIVAYKTYLESGERRQQMEHKPFTDPQFGECYSPIGKIECIVIRGCDAVERLRPLRQRLRDATEAAYADKALRPAADALATGIPFMPVGADETVNRSNTFLAVDSVTGEKRRFCEYIRANVLDVLDRALKRMPTAEEGNVLAGGESHRGDGVDGKPAMPPLTGNEVINTVNRMLENDPPWDWKKTKGWLEQREVRIYNRKTWEQTFGSPQPTAKGNVALVDEREVHKAIRAELQLREMAFDTMDEVERLRRK
ncbi:MAG: hypothetical protein AABZ12_11935 [Planctomycetota bacterium]